jgi:hypothetical protein
LSEELSKNGKDSPYFLHFLLKHSGYTVSLV